MASGANRMRTVDVDGEKWVSVADMVTAFRDMAERSEGVGRENLLRVAAVFTPLLGAGELLPVTHLPDAGPCQHCGVMVYTLARHGSGEPITLNARPTVYGPWVITAPLGREPLAVSYAQHRPGAQGWSRYRVHVCPEGSTNGDK